MHKQPQSYLPPPQNLTQLKHKLQKSFQNHVNPQTIVKLTLIAAIIYSLTSTKSEQPELAESSVPKRRTLPSVLIIGARKCGTRALIDMLNLHPQVSLV